MLASSWRSPVRLHPPRVVHPKLTQGLGEVCCELGEAEACQAGVLLFASVRGQCVPKDGSTTSTGSTGSAPLQGNLSGLL